MENNRSIYTPHLMEVVAVFQETPDVKRVRIKFRDPEDAKQYRLNVGQFGLYSVFGVGESTFNICCSNSKDYIEFCFRNTGRVTERMWDVEPGDTIGFRGPFGNSYPMKEWEGKNLVFVAGGIAMPPIRCAIQYALENRDKYGKIVIVYGAKTIADLVGKSEYDEWAACPDVDLTVTVDPGGENDEWGKTPKKYAETIGFVPTVLGDVLKRLNLPADNSAALVVGPPIMIKFSLPVLEEAQFTWDNIVSSLENRMKCGLGKCGRCNCGSVYVCKEGPVFTYTQIKQMPDDF
ncbi:MAG: FAD/NAD(P)-binding protein [Thermoguttaceae bacterium]|nr:FAD/NAD(P)-binding protein [Thermoguttaceae bacterium]